jgi:tRNA modification GTPase
MKRSLAINSSDTIAAISTPTGQGGLGIVRISGPDALRIADEIFLCKKGLPSSFPTHTVHHGQVHGGSAFIDNALLIIMHAPRTYTGENTVEISCHGGRIVLHKTLAAAIGAGARPANPGEFTMRAFLNGKLDLSQAEAVQQLIAAQNELAFRVASEQLRGKLHDRIEAIRSQVLDVAAVVEASIDFPEEDIEFSPTEELCERLTSAREGIENLLSTFEDGARIAEGVNVVITGKTNVGKSTLLNALFEKDVAIVTPVAGTTRDVLKESLILQGISLNVFDTAGIRKPRGIVEKEGVKRSKKAVREADLVLFVLDADAGVSDEDRRIFREIAGKKFIVVVNKIDLVPDVDDEALASELRGPPPSQPPDRAPSSAAPGGEEAPAREAGSPPRARTSALKLEGIEDLKQRITENVWSGDIPSVDHAIITSVRHRDALRRAGEALHRALEALRQGLSPEFPAVEIREALEALGLITGETTDEEILDRIFSKFCIGK